MDLFSDRSLLTMLHGIGLGGGSMMALFGSLLLLAAAPTEPAVGGDPGRSSRLLALLTAGAAGALWLTVLVGTYLVFPPYRATPPEGTTVLTEYPRSLLLSDPGTAWLHAFAMESKEHLPWIAAFLTTAVAFVAVRYPVPLRADRSVRRAALFALALALALVSYMALLGVFVNKVAPLE